MLVENKYGPREIATKCGVSIDTVRDVRRGKTWKKISKDYNFSHYDKKSEPGAKGEKNSRSTISNDTAKQICELIESNTLTLPEIAKICDVTYKIVQHIYNRSSWKSLSSKYDFTKYTLNKNKKERSK